MTTTFTKALLCTILSTTIYTQGFTTDVLPAGSVGQSGTKLSLLTDPVSVADNPMFSDGASPTAAPLSAAETVNRTQWTDDMCAQILSNSKKKNSSIKDSRGRKSCDERDQQAAESLKMRLNALDTVSFQKFHDIFSKFYDRRFDRVSLVDPFFTKLTANIDIIHSIFMRVKLKDSASSVVEKHLSKDAVSALGDLSADALNIIAANVDAYTKIEQYSSNTFSGTGMGDAFFKVYYLKKLSDLKVANPELVEKTLQILGYACTNGVSSDFYPGIVSAFCEVTDIAQITPQSLDFLLGVFKVKNLLSHVTIKYGYGENPAEVDRMKDIDDKAIVVKRIAKLLLGFGTNAGAVADVTKIVRMFADVKEKKTMDDAVLLNVLTTYNTARTSVMAIVDTAEAALVKANKCAGLLCSKEKGVNDALLAAGTQFEALPAQS